MARSRSLLVATPLSGFRKPSICLPARSRFGEGRDIFEQPAQNDFFGKLLAVITEPTASLASGYFSLGSCGEKWSAKIHILEAIFLGFVQGMAEFLPISSSGHLVFFQSLLGLKEPQLFFDVMLHLGTLLAVVVFFRKDIARIVQGFMSMLKRERWQM